MGLDMWGLRRVGILSQLDNQFGSSCRFEGEGEGEAQEKGERELVK